MLQICIIEELGVKTTLCWLWVVSILVHRGQAPFVQHQGTWPQARPDFLTMPRAFFSHSKPIRFVRFDGKSIRFTDFQCGSSQRLWFSLLTKRSMSPEDEKGLSPLFVSYIFQAFKLENIWVFGNGFKISKRWFNVPAFQLQVFWLQVKGFFGNVSRNPRIFFLWWDWGWLNKPHWQTVRLQMLYLELSLSVN